MCIFLWLKLDLEKLHAFWIQALFRSRNAIYLKLTQDQYCSFFSGALESIHWKTTEPRVSEFLVIQFFPLLMLLTLKCSFEKYSLELRQYKNDPFVLSRRKVLKSPPLQCFFAPRIGDEKAQQFQNWFSFWQIGVVYIYVSVFALIRGFHHFYVH